MVNSRKKGNKAENEVANILSHYFGGRFSRRSMGQRGEDLQCPSWFPYCPEIKNCSALRLKHLWRETKLLIGFWNQCAEQAAAINKKPLLIAKIEGIWLCWTDDLPGPFWQTSRELEKWCNEKRLEINPIDKQSQLKVASPNKPLV